ncbi:MAG: TetR/AcrR family transcriptional regulator [Chloroflexi bacterium]|nr:TetR/AcrR family transcriptional regulator [Chloroflexota bacterium]
MSSAREEILQATTALLEKQGSHATGLNEIIRESGAPKGSLYYYFPEGKDQLVSEAVLAAGQGVAARIRANLADIGLAAFILRIAENVESSGFAAGSPLTAVAMETATTNERINLACREAYGLLVTAFQDYLQTNGVEPGRALEQATFITAAIEGGIILSRTYHTADPLRTVAGQLGLLRFGVF